MVAITRSQERLKIVGLVPVAIIAVLAGLLALVGFRGPIFDPPYLALILQFIFVFMVSILLAIVSARAYLMSGSLNTLLVGIAPMVSGSLLMLAQWAVTPSLGSNIDPNEAVTMGNLGILFASFLLFIGAILLLIPKERNWSGASRRFILLGSYSAAFVLIIVVIMASIANLFPVFFTSGGSTIWRQAVLATSAGLLSVSCVLFGWTFIRTRSPLLYWYSLGLVSFGVSLIGIIFTIKIGESVNWCGRLGLYLSGIFFILAVLNRSPGEGSRSGISQRWADAFKNDREQIATLFAKMLNGFAYCEIIMDKIGKPVDFTYLDVNPAFEQNHGVQKEDVIGSKATMVHPGIENDPTDPIGKFGHVALTEDPVDFETYSISEKKWFHYSVYSPRKGYFVSISEDITEGKKAEEKLRNSEKMYRSIGELIPYGVWTANAQGETTFISRSFCEMVGKNEESLLKLGWLDTLDPETVEKTTAAWTKTIQSGDFWNYTHHIRGKDGQYRYVLSRGAPIRDDDGTILGWVGVNINITEQKIIEENLTRSNAELQQFAYLSSHDLQEPLRMVVSYLSLLERKYKDQLDPKAQEYIGNALEGGARMRQLIDDLLEYSRVDTKGKEFTVVDMGEVLEDTIKVLKVPIDESKADIFVGPLPDIRADGTQMRQVMQNLVANAIKFRGPDRPMVHITANQGEREWTFSVKDNGIGLNVEYSDRIFQMFQRLHTKDKYPGTGVGLAIAKKIVERHGGRIWVESEEGKGATFHFTIPREGRK
ncbi:MAG TPA: ATP-binding protein [Methanomassiliicoccales archaeon]|jgi:PAS domain S-box-containing protein